MRRVLRGLYYKEAKFSITRFILANTWFVVMFKYVFEGLIVTKIITTGLADPSIKHILWECKFDYNAALALLGFAGTLYWGNFNMKIGNNQFGNGGPSQQKSPEGD